MYVHACMHVCMYICMHACMWEQCKRASRPLQGTVNGGTVSK